MSDAKDSALESHDPYKIGALKHLQRNVRFSPKHEVVTEVGVVFSDSLNRVGCLATFVPQLLGLVLQKQEVTCAAHQQLGARCGRITDLGEQQRLLDHCEKLESELTGEKGKKGLEDLRWVNGVELWNDALTTNPLGNQPFRDAIEALLPSILFGIWSAFEILATDLWVKTVDIRPKSLAMNIAKKRRNRGNEPPGPNKPEQPAAVSYDALADQGFDVSRSMGTFLKDQGRVDFQSFGTIKNAYLDAFLIAASANRGGLQESTQLKELWNSDKAKAMGALENIRNLIAHRGGLVDGDFRTNIAKYDNRYLALEKGETLKTNGVMVTNYFGYAIGLGADLMTFVDEWLSTHAE